MALGLLLILLAAWRSEGFFNADEHFQILEFAGSKLDRTPATALPWEHHERMRPWLQPGLYTIGARSLAALGVDDPFSWAFAFRVFSGLLAWLGLVGLSRCAERWFADEAAQRMAVRALVLLYFVPFLAVRTSAESLSTSCFVLALCLVVLRGDARGPGIPVLVGVLLGLSFGLRYAAGVMVASLFAWMAIVARTPLRRVGWIAVGIAAALALAAVVDRWGYGEWTLAAWNYVRLNLGEDRAAGRFGAEPWYGYLMILARGPVGALNLILAAAAAVAWVRHPRHVLTWATAPLAVVHSAIAHKELRFLFPIAMLAAPLLVLAAGGLPRRWWARVVAAGVLACNLAGLALGCLLPAQPQVAFLRFASRRFPWGLEAFVASPRSPWVSGELTMWFYGPPPPGLRRWTGASDLVAGGTRRFNLLTSSWDPLPPVEPYACRALYRSAPEWMSRHGWPAGAGAAPRAWDLFRCVGPQHGTGRATNGGAASRAPA